MAAGEEEKSLHFKLWPPSVPLPSSSILALEASKCAELQGSEAFDRYHLLLFESYFEQNQDISCREVLLSLARDARLDYSRFTLDFNSGKQKKKVWEEYNEACHKYNIVSIPTVLFGEERRFECVVPLELYRRAASVSLGQSLTQ